MAAASERDREALSLFVDEMRAMREQRGWSQAELAAAAGYSESLIAMVETYQRAPTKPLATALDRVFGLPGTYSRLQSRVRNMSFPASFRPFADHEEEAIRFRWFEHSLVPGLLQTGDYAHAVLSTLPNSTGAQIEAAVADRMARQSVLMREGPAPPLLWVLLDEGILHRPVALPSVMHDQLNYLADVSQQFPNVTVNVVPYAAGGHSGLLGAFILADLQASQSIVFTEDICGGRVDEEPARVTDVELRFDALRSEALPKAASRDLIAKVANEEWMT